MAELLVWKRLRRQVICLSVAAVVVSGTAFAQNPAAPVGAQAAGELATANGAPVASLPAFEVATIKPAAPSPDGHTHIRYPPDGSFSASNISLLLLMEWAYSMPQRQILEGPSWLGSERFDIQAKSDGTTDTQMRALGSERSTVLKRRMVQALLADRYALRFHEEVRTLPAYDLILAKGGSKLQMSHSDGRSVGTGRTHLHAEGVTMAMVCESLSEIAGRAVVDKTNLKDRYDVKLEWSADDQPATQDSAPPLFTAIEEQLGLKLVPAKEPLPVLVIDHLEQPSAN